VFFNVIFVLNVIQNHGKRSNSTFDYRVADYAYLTAGAKYLQFVELINIPIISP
jgi:hypothetical protein